MVKALFIEENVAQKFYIAAMAISVRLKPALP